jgi:hypothetical protein
VNQTEHRYFDEDANNMVGIDLQTLVASRLDDLADQVEVLYRQGNLAEAELLRDEGLMLAEAYDNEIIFMYLPDFTAQ